MDDLHHVSSSDVYYSVWTWYSYDVFNLDGSCITYVYFHAFNTRLEER